MEPTQGCSQYAVKWLALPHLMDIPAVQVDEEGTATIAIALEPCEPVPLYEPAELIV